MLRTVSVRTPVPTAALPSGRSSAGRRLQVKVAASGQYSAEQLAFLERKAREAKSAPPAPQPTRGRSGSSRPNYRTASPRPTSAPAQPATPAYQPAAPVQIASREAEVEAARASLERTVGSSAAPHPQDRYVSPSPPPQAIPTGPSTGRWPDPAFFQETLAAFPAKAVADVEEARCLIDAGYKLLDVRTELESNARGKIRGSVSIPCAFAKQAYDASRGEMVVTEEDNPSFIAQVARKFPRKDTPLLIACKNGSQYSVDVLEALEEEGYTNLVGLQGGINAFTRVFDIRMNPKDGRPVMKRSMKKLL